MGRADLIQIAHALADPGTRDLYLMVCFALLVLPMIGLSIWYHRNINETEGGRRLMERQNAAPPLPGGGYGAAQRNMRQAGEMARDIEAGAYGEAARRLQRKTYWFAGAWLLLNMLAFGLLIWADEVNKAAG